jgi:hypothetical protein
VSLHDRPHLRGQRPHKLPSVILEGGIDHRQNGDEINVRIRVSFALVDADVDHDLLTIPKVQNVLASEVGEHQQEALLIR